MVIIEILLVVILTATAAAYLIVSRVSLTKIGGFHFHFSDGLTAEDFLDNLIKQMGGNVQEYKIIDWLLTNLDAIQDACIKFDNTTLLIGIMSKYPTSPSIVVKICSILFNYEEEKKLKKKQEIQPAPDIFAKSSKTIQPPKTLSAYKLPAKGTDKKKEEKRR